jgi:hypothetical protein
METGYFKGAARSRLYGKGLSDDDVRAIRAAEGTLREIGKRYAMSDAMVHHIKHKRRWASVPDAIEGEGLV